MPHEVELKQVTFRDPIWHPATKTKPGAQVNLCVTAAHLQGGQTVTFDVHDEKGFLLSLPAAQDGGSYKVQNWKVPNTFAAGKRLRFHAILHEEPSPANGHMTVRRKLESPELEVDGFKVEINSRDAAFVPGLENLRL